VGFLVAVSLANGPLEAIDGTPVVDINLCFEVRNSYLLQAGILRCSSSSRQNQVVQQLEGLWVYRPGKRTRCVRPLLRDCGRWTSDAARGGPCQLRDRTRAERTASCECREGRGKQVSRVSRSVLCFGTPNMLASDRGIVPNAWFERRQS